MGWIGVDLDKTLAHYEPPFDPMKIGAPVPAMLNRVLDWLNAGQEVRIFTARASVPEHVAPVIEWCKEHLGREIPVTNIKDYAMLKLYDDRAVQVEENTGRLIG